MGSSFERHWDLGFVEEFVIGVLGSGIVIGISLVREVTEQVPHVGVAEALLHVVGEDSLLGHNHIAIRIASVVLFVVVLLLMFELGVLDQFLFAACHERSRMDRHVVLVLQIQLLSSELILVRIANVGRWQLREQLRSHFLLHSLVDLDSLGWLIGWVIMQVRLASW